MTATRRVAAALRRWLSPQARAIAAAAVGVVVLLTLLALLRPGERPLDRAAELRQRLHVQVLQLLDADQLARSDGYTYTVDVAQLMTYAAMRRNVELYDALHDRLIDRAVINELGVPFTSYFVAWRWGAADAPPDASGTTEALRLAEALWTGGHALGRPADRDLAVLILEAYLRHATVDQDTWIVRNYFNLGTGAFATNSYLVDYDPDLLRNVALTREHAVLADAAARSADLVRNAVTPAGLLHSIIQPEVRTLMPGMAPIFSPNNIEQLGNVATVAERSVGTAQPVAEAVLDFAVARRLRLHRFYDASTGLPVGKDKAGLPDLAPLLRLAVRVGDAHATDALLSMLLERGEHWADRPTLTGDDLYALSETLLALQTLLHPSQP